MKSNRYFSIMTIWSLVFVSLFGCKALAPTEMVAKSMSVNTDAVLHIPVQEAWGGEVQCGGHSCRMIVVEHEGNAVSLYRFVGRSAELLDKAPVGYHPDSAKWLDGRYVIAAVEGSHSIDVFDAKDDRLNLVYQIPIKFPPRDVVLISALENRYRFLAVPYQMEDAAWVELEFGGEGIKHRITYQQWCRFPMHPFIVPSVPFARERGVVAACERDYTVKYQRGVDAPGVLQEGARLKYVPRQVIPSLDGRWWYVTQELGGASVRIRSEDGVRQTLVHPILGTLSVAPLDDAWIVWGGRGSTLMLQRYDEDGVPLETRMRKSSGFPTGLQVLDIDGDGYKDLIVYNSIGGGVDVIFGPLIQRFDRVSENGF